MTKMTKEDALFFLGRFRTKGINEKLYDALGVAIEALKGTNGDTISKSEVCEILADIYPTDGEKVVAVKEIDRAYEAIQQLPSAHQEPSIPLSWIEGQIEWLRSLDDAFASMTAGQISAMVEKWKGEQDG